MLKFYSSIRSLKVQIILLLCVCTYDARAQYILTVDTAATYTNITDVTYSIPGHSPYFGNITTKPNMSFKAYSQTYDLINSVYIPIKQGYCYFDNGQRSLTLYGCDGSYSPITGQTLFSFKTDETADNHIFIMEWQHLGFEGAADSFYINFQVWLHENGIIEYRFGNSKLKDGLFNDGNNGPSIGILEMDASFSTIYNQVWLDGDPSKPTEHKTYAVYNLDKAPKPGTIYRFTPTTSSITNIKASETVQVFPNPARDILMAELGVSGIYTANITDIAGKVISVGSQISEKTISADISALSRGLYLINIIDSEGLLVCQKKFVKE